MSTEEHDDLGKLKVAVKLLEKSTKKEAVQGFLKGKQLTYSGTWDDILNKRIIPAFDANKISLEEVYSLLASVEEYGRQHIFLYQIPDKLLDQITNDKLRERFEQSEFAELIDSPKILDIPDEFTIVDVRLSSSSFVVKAVTKRTTYTSLGHRVEGDRLIKEYSIEHSRSLYILKVHGNGLCEVRITSSATSTDKYKDLIEVFLRKLMKVIPTHEISRYPINLQTAKNKIWDDRMSLRSMIRFSDATLNNGFSYLRAATGSMDADLLTDRQVVESVDSFSGDSVCCDSHNIFFKTITGQKYPTKELHVRMSGDLNEFVIPATIERDDYMYILNKILGFNDG
ncbi:hypothetical protein J6J08_08325 [Pseudidiomarina sp. 1APR75-33.1]|uniref:hypothetical protein n=1 Tax=Pseudidiomarina terrestris TaxID=2820060 RepID=UPI0026542CEB|nr:hypothetical protein [Pseudidiomarina sp. 1APR75-33.1]MDN7127387.1 hypothetical protein [Pseudidiomarina sp. 1APR75-33.1]